jgi:capsular exopolysaccharide synthesis family protein
MALGSNNPGPVTAANVDWSTMIPLAAGASLPRYQHSFASRLPILRRRWRQIALFVVLASAAAAVWSQHMVPMYESTALIDADRQASAGVVGENAERSFSESDTDEFLSTQMKLIQSDAVLRPVVQKYDLLRVEHQRIRAANRSEAPVELKYLKVIRSPRTHLLYITYTAADRHLAANVANAIANSYITHSYRTRLDASSQLSSFMETQLHELKDKMEVSKQRQAEFARELDVVDPEQKTNVLTSRMLELNTEYTKAQADRVLKEASYNATKSGNLAAVQVSSEATALNNLGEKVNNLRATFVSVKSTYGENHPQYKKAAADLAEGIRQYHETQKDISKRIAVDYRQAVDRERMIRKSVTSTKAELDKLTSRALDYEQLKHEAEADTKLYEELVRRTREAGLNSSFQGSAIRMADVARPAAEPVTPRPVFNVAVAFLASLLLGVGTAFLSESVNARVHGPDQVQVDLNTRVIGTLPDVRRLSAGHNLGLEGGAAPLVSFMKGQPIADELIAYAESIRRLRNSLLLSEVSNPIRSVLVTSGLRGEGKSTTALHLAISCANQHKRTLLIDADMRYPTVQTRLGLPYGPGLATVLTNRIPICDAIVAAPGVPHLFAMRAGEAQQRASDLVGPGILNILREATQEYDLVVLDAPPLLAFAETLQLAAAVDGVAVITHAGHSSTHSLNDVLSSLATINARLIGVVLNRFRQNRSAYYYRERQYPRMREA